MPRPLTHYGHLFAFVDEKSNNQARANVLSLECPVSVQWEPVLGGERPGVGSSRAGRQGREPHAHTALCQSCLFLGEAVARSGASETAQALTDTPRPRVHVSAELQLQPGQTLPG